MSPPSPAPRAPEALGSDDRGDLGIASRVRPSAQSEGDLRDAHTLLRLATEAADLAIWSFDIATGQSSWDRRMRELYGVPADADVPAEALDALWRARIHPDDRERMWAGAADTIGGSSTRGTEFRIVLPDGSIRFLHLAFFGERSAEGRPLRLVGVNRDVTGQRALEQRLRDAKEAAERAKDELLRHRDRLEATVEERTRDLAKARDDAETANRAKSSFLATMGHELRTPLHQILGTEHLLRAHVGSEEGRQRLDQLRRGAHRLSALIGEILDYAELEARQVSLAPIDFGLDALLDRAVEDVSALAAGKGIAVVVDRDPELPDWLRGDAPRLAQMLRHLIGNAVKFSERGRIVVRARSVGAPAGQATVRFEVQDQGIGMSPEVRAGLFQPFSPGDASVARRYGGAGLGLALCHRLCALMAGEIGVESALGSGSTFWFEVKLPLGEAPSSKLEARPDWARVHGLVVALDRLLAEDDIQARVVWAEQRARLDAVVLGPRAAAFAACMEAFEFSKARALLRAAAFELEELPPLDAA